MLEAKAVFFSDEEKAEASNLSAQQMKSDLGYAQEEKGGSDVGRHDGEPEGTMRKRNDFTKGDTIGAGLIALAMVMKVDGKT